MAEAGSPALAAGSSGRLGRIVGYGAARGGVELLLGARGVALAALLGPGALGAWSLLRVAAQYLIIVGLGVQRGLEVEAAAHRGRCGAEPDPMAERYAAAGNAFLLVSYGALTVLALCAAALTSDPTWRVILAGIAVTAVVERLWFQAATFLRAQAGVSEFALVELAHAVLQLAVPLPLALVWGLDGAVVGLALAYGGGIALMWGRVPLRSRWCWRSTRTMIRIGWPVTVGILLQILLGSADRLIVAALSGVDVLGQYAFAVSVASIGAAAGFIVRTAVFPEIFHAARHGAPEAWVRDIERLLVTLAWTLSLLLGLLSLGIGPMIGRYLPEYASAVGAARIYMFTGVAQGLMAVAMLGSQAADRQRLIPPVTALAVAASAALAWAALQLGLGLEGLAAASLATRLGYAVALAALGRPATSWRHELRFAGGLALPVVVACLLAQLIAG
jgi:O-antigen/teichoic acid export membrane protein